VRPAILLIGLLIAPVAGAVAADRATWTIVGQEQLGAREQRVVVPVTRDVGPIERLQIETAHGRAYVEAMTVIYDTGGRERLLVGADLKPGAPSAIYELGAVGRRVEAVEVIGQATGTTGDRTLLRLRADTGNVPGAATSAAVPSRLDRYFSRSAARRVVVLDSRPVDPRLDQHLLHPGDRHPSADAWRLRVRGGPLHVQRLVVVAADGRTSAIEVDRVLQNGEATRTLPLAADLREVLVLVAPSRTRRPATLDLEGLVVGSAGPAEPPPGWQLLGSGTGLDRDVIEFGSDTGPLGAIALNVAGGNITLARLIFVYADGRRDVRPVGKEIPDGTFTPAVALKGDSPLRRLELYYAAGDPGATIEVYGQPPA